MNRIISLLGIFSLVSAVSCQQEIPFPQESPVVVTNLKAISASGVVFEGKIMSLGSEEEIIEYGFLWSTDPVAIGTTPNKKIVGTSQTELVFQYNLTSGIFEGESYFVRAYIKTNNFLVYGTTVDFIGQGSSDPQIFDIQPNSAFDGDEISIHGINFNPVLSENLVRIGGVVAEVKFASETLLKVKVPVTTFVGEAYISIRRGDNVEIISEMPLTILGPRINSVSDQTLRVGDILTLHGEYFDSNTEVVFFNSQIKLQILQFTASLIKVMIPDNINLTDQISVKGGIKVYTFPQYISIIDSWEELTPAPIGSLPQVSSATVDDKVYAFVGYDFISASLSDTVFEFNPVQGSWTPKEPFPGGTRVVFICSALGKDVLYGLGQDWVSGDYIDDLWMYDSETNSWTPKGVFPAGVRAEALTLTIGDKIYIGFGWNGNFVYDLWSFDPVNNVWQEFSNIPQERFTQSFAVNGKGYFVGPTGMWEFDPLNQQWTKKSNFTSNNLLYPKAVSVNNKGYIVKTINGKNEIWEYNSGENLWLKKQTFPGTPRAEAFFAAGNNRIYFGAGYQNNPGLSTNDFWELILE